MLKKVCKSFRRNCSTKITLVICVATLSTEKGGQHTRNSIGTRRAAYFRSHLAFAVVDLYQSTQVDRGANCSINFNRVLIRLHTCVRFAKKWRGVCTSLYYIDDYLWDWQTKRWEAASLVCHSKAVQLNYVRVDRRHNAVYTSMGHGPAVNTRRVLIYAFFIALMRRIMENFGGEVGITYRKVIWSRRTLLCNGWLIQVALFVDIDMNFTNMCRTFFLDLCTRMNQCEFFASLNFGDAQSAARGLFVNEYCVSEKDLETTPCCSDVKCIGNKTAKERRVEKIPWLVFITCFSLH